MHLYLVRHGESVANQKQLFYGQSNHPLTPRGRAQASEAADKLRHIHFNRCIASDLIRAWDTALICTEGHTCRPEVCPDLREQNIGLMEDMSWEELAKQFPESLNAYVHDWFGFIPPKGEAPEDMTIRVRRCLETVLASNEDTLIVAHNGPLTLILILLGIIGQEQAYSREWFFSQGTYTDIEITEGKARLVVFNR